MSKVISLGQGAYLYLHVKAFAPKLLLPSTEFSALASQHMHHLKTVCCLACSFTSKLEERGQMRLKEVDVEVVMR